MKILYLTDQTYLHGGIEKVLSQKANYLADAAGFEVLICTYNQQGRKPVYTFSEKIRMLDLGVNYQIGLSYFSPVNLGKIPHHQRALKKLLRKEQPDLVVSCSFGPDFYFLPFTEKQIPKIKEFHSSRFFSAQQTDSHKTQFLRKLGAWTETKYKQLVVLNEDEKQFYTGDRIIVIPNPVELSGYRSNPSAKAILAAGRISPVKNFGMLINAFAKLAPDFPDWHIDIWGEDYLSTKEKLQQQVMELGLQNRVNFPGVTADLKKEMQQYSLYAMTSETECFPMVLLEALSVGLPVITHDCPTGPRHIVQNGSDAFITPYQDIESFATHLRDLMSDENLRGMMSKNAVANAQRFHIDKVMQDWITLFKSLTEKL